MIKKLFMFLFITTTLLCSDKFKLGDFVWHTEYGWGIVVSVDNSNKYPIKVQFIRSTSTFTLEGERVIGENRTLFFQEIVIPEICLKRNGEDISKPTQNGGLE